MTTVIGFLSLPTELICHVLLLLPPRDICRCAITCKAFRDAAWNSVDVQYRLELYAQGFTETTTLKSIAVSRKMSSLKKLVSLWLSDFHLNTVFEEAVVVDAWPDFVPRRQHVKCGLWWMEDRINLFIRDYNRNINLSRTWPRRTYGSHYLTMDPLQDLMAIVVFSRDHVVTVTDAEQDHYVFRVECRSASSQRYHPDSVCPAVECKHTFNAPGLYRFRFMTDHAICGDRIFVYYYIEDMDGIPVSTTFMQVIDWREGYVKSHPLCPPGTHGIEQNFRLVDEQTIIVIGSQGQITLFKLQEIDASPQARITYLLPKCRDGCIPYPPTVHATLSFCGAAARTDLMPGHVPSLESQIMVLEIFSNNESPIILVIDMVVFSGMALLSETYVEIPWLEWGPQHTCCFPHHTTHQISVFGSKMAYALPQDHTPEPGQRLEALSAEGHFYVHIWDFNTRIIARSENMYDPDSPNTPILKPGVVTQSCFDGEIISNHPYTATVCRTPFLADFPQLFLEQDRLILSWVRLDKIDIRVVSPAQMEDVSRINFSDL